MAQLPADRVRVVGVGEVTDRPADPLRGKGPVALMAEALRLAGGPRDPAAEEERLEGPGRPWLAGGRTAIAIGAA